MADVPEQSTNVAAPGRVTLTGPPPNDIPAPVSDSLSREVYRPLSLLAVVGCALAVLYAFLVLVGGLLTVGTASPRLLASLLILAPLGGLLAALLVRERRTSRVWLFAAYGLLGMVMLLGLGGLLAYAGTRPWLLHSMTWLLVATALLLSWLALTQIRASEDTLGGAELARWGIKLSLFFGLIYGAYRVSNTFAIYRQAGAAAEEFLELLKNGEMEQAFIRTLPVTRRPPGWQSRGVLVGTDQGAAVSSDLTQRLQVEHNVVRNPSEPGSFSSFRMSAPALLILMANKDVKWEQTASTSTFERGAYKVALTYHVTTPLATFDLTVTTEGQEETTEAGGRRRYWNVVLDETGFLRGTTPESTSAGKNLFPSVVSAGGTANIWSKQLKAGDLSGCYLMTLPPSQRSTRAFAVAYNRPAAMAALGITLPGAEQFKPKILEEVRKAEESFRRGEEPVLDTEHFWSDPLDTKLRARMLAAVKRIFTPEGAIGIELGPYERRQIHIFRFEPIGDHVRVYVPIRLVTGGEKTLQPEFIFEAELVVKVPVTEEQIPVTKHQIEKLRLLRGQTSPKPTLEKR